RLADFNRQISKIFSQPIQMDDDGSLTPFVLSLEPEAKAAWVAFHNAIEGELKSGGELQDVRDLASKAADNAARLAALFQVFENGSEAISKEVFEGASRVVG